MRRLRTVTFSRAVVVVAVVLAAAALSACEQCLIRPCGFCYDATFSAALRDPPPPPPELPPALTGASAPMPH